MTVPLLPLVGDERIQELVESCFAPGSDKPVKWRIQHAIRLAIKEAGEECAKISESADVGKYAQDAVAAVIRRRL